MKLEYIINAAEKLNAYESADDCIAEVSKAIDTDINVFGDLAEYYDTVVTVFVMAVNKSLYLAPSVEGEEPADHYDAVDNYVREIFDKFKKFIGRLKKNVGYDDHEMFCDYLQKLAKYIIYNFNKHTCPDKDYDFPRERGWGLWERDKSMRKDMFKLIEHNQFTKKYSMQIPYMYVLVFDYSDLFSDRFHISIDYSKEKNRHPSNDTEYEKSLPYYVREGLRHIRDDRLLNIMKINDCGLPDPKAEKAGITIYDEGSYLNFDQLLPGISEEDANGWKQGKYLEVDYENMSIAVMPEFYVTVPLVPAAPVRANGKEYILEIFKQDIKNEDLNRKLKQKNAELEQKNAELKQAQEDKAEIIRDFAHTYKNLSVTQLYEIATVLLKDESYRDYGKRLLVEYETKQNLTKEVEMVQLKFEDRIDELYTKIINSLSDDRETAVTVRKALDIAFRRCLVTAFHSKSGLGETLRDSFDEISGFDINKAENSFDNNVICGDGVSCADWVNGNLFPLKVTVSSEWEKVLMKNESYAVLMLISILAELIQNVLKYADLPKGVDVSFEDADDILIIRFQNSFSKDANCRRLKNSGEGLESKNSVLQTLNKAAGCDDSWTAVETQSEENRFTTVVRVKKICLFGRNTAMGKFKNMLWIEDNTGDDDSDDNKIIENYFGDLSIYVEWIKTFTDALNIITDMVFKAELKDVLKEISESETKDESQDEPKESNDRKFSEYDWLYLTSILKRLKIVKRY